MGEIWIIFVNETSFVSRAGEISGNLMHAGRFWDLVAKRRLAGACWV